jgi:hypothetical protein
MSGTKAMMREMILAQITQGMELACEGQAILDLATAQNWGEDLIATVRHHLDSVHKNLDLYAAELRRLDEMAEVGA